uniref:hypothetical protein n=1 Tax=Nitrospira cf. moscoviensis SBR1015 TaxID=96242 RepID=UPI000B3BC934|nr:hypothetical protein [Nitrospira cf. moscoviensis SBR1015]
MDPKHLRDLVIKPACEAIGLYSLAAEELLLGTACQESKCGTFLKQLGKGPALGIFQMEPRTYHDHWSHFLVGRELGQKAGAMAYWGSTDAHPAPEQMIWNLRFAAAMCRIHYYRVKDPLPAAGDIPAQAAYWKRFYNTPKGAGTVEEYLNNWRKLS